MSDIADRVRRIVSEQLGVTEEMILGDKSFVDDLGAESVDLMELVITIEDEFGIEIPNDMASHLITVADAITFVTHAVQ